MRKKTKLSPTKECPPDATHWLGTDPNDPVDYYKKIDNKYHYWSWYTQQWYPTTISDEKISRLIEPITTNIKDELLAVANQDHEVVENKKGWPPGATHWRGISIDDPLDFYKLINNKYCYWSSDTKTWYPTSYSDQGILEVIRPLPVKDKNKTTMTTLTDKHYKQVGGIKIPLGATRYRLFEDGSYIWENDKGHYWSDISNSVTVGWFPQLSNTFVGQSTLYDIPSTILKAPDGATYRDGEPCGREIFYKKKEGAWYTYNEDRWCISSNAPSWNDLNLVPIKLPHITKDPVGLSKKEGAKSLVSKEKSQAAVKLYLKATHVLLSRRTNKVYSKYNNTWYFLVPNQDIWKKSFHQDDSSFVEIRGTHRHRFGEARPHYIKIKNTWYVAEPRSGHHWIPAISQNDKDYEETHNPHTQGIQGLQGTTKEVLSNPSIQGLQGSTKNSSNQPLITTTSNSWSNYNVTTTGNATGAITMEKAEPQVLSSKFTVNKTYFILTGPLGGLVLTPTRIAEDEKVAYFSRFGWDTVKVPFEHMVEKQPEPELPINKREKTAHEELLIATEELVSSANLKRIEETKARLIAATNENLTEIAAIKAVAQHAGNGLNQEKNLTTTYSKKDAALLCLCSFTMGVAFLGLLTLVACMMVL